MKLKQLLINTKKVIGCIYRPLESHLQSAILRQRTRYAYYYKYLPLKNDTIMYESFFGRGMLCNPYALFLELLNNPKYKHFRHVWVLDNIDHHKMLINTYSKYKNVTFIQYQSYAYLKYLCSAKYLINNVTFPSYFTKKEGQIYINTWHGIPLKSLGYDVPNGRIETANVIRNFMHTDYLISANDFLTNIYNTSHKLSSLYSGKIIEEGYPRLDLLSRFSKSCIYDKMDRYGLRIDPLKKIILYAPTWRGTSYSEANADVDCYFLFKSELEEVIDTQEYQILIKVHQRVYQLSKDKLSSDYFVPATIDANEILAITDILISDFSSIFFDFLATGKPILFYIKDVEDYKVERGMYMGTDHLPGPNTDSLVVLGNWINHVEEVQEEYKERYENMCCWSNATHSGQISKRIVDIIFEGNVNGYKIITPQTNKKKILFSRGEMLVNGISASLLNLLNALDYQHFDVSVMISTIRNSEQEEFVKNINPNIRIFYRDSTYNMTFGEHVQHMYRSRFGYRKIRYSMYCREFLRIYGEAEFDYIIDFEGYNTFYSTLILQDKKSQKGIWLHSDMLAEQQLRFPWLENIFKLYQYFPMVISCSYEIMLVNRDNLSGRYCDYNQFKYVRNFIDAKRVKDGAKITAMRIYNGQTFLAVNEEILNGCINTKLIPYYSETINENKIYRFVTVGRLSPEKNHTNLIAGFNKLYKDNPNVYLYILGDGPLKKKLVQQIKRLNLDNHVILTGNVKNPFAILKHCDCFILPSLHEGQPVVINEARVMHMPIIVSNFSSVKGALMDNGQLIINTDEESIYNGLTAFINHEVPSDYCFDADQYNQEAYQEFLNALGECEAERRS